MHLLSLWTVSYTHLSIELNTSDFEMFMANKQVLENLGFKIEEFGINTIITVSYTHLDVYKRQE